MVNPANAFFYFYRRYKWTASDFTNFQNAMATLPRDAMAGLLGGAVLTGFGVSSVSGLLLQAASGVACGSDGYLMAITGSSNVAVTASNANPVKHLIVCRKMLVDANLITSPTSPFSQVPLNQLQEAQVLVLGGTPAASPSYPPALSGDVVLCGISLAASASTIASSNIDLIPRSRLGQNNFMARPPGRYDYLISSTDPLATHASLAIFCADTGILAGSRVLVGESQALQATAVLPTVDNLFIDFAPGSSITNGASVTSAIQVGSKGCRLNNPRIQGFTNGIVFATGAEYGAVYGARFKTVTNEIVDSATTSGAANTASFTEV